MRWNYLSDIWKLNLKYGLRNAYRISSVSVGKPRKLKAIWTPEMARDVEAFHNIDIEAEITQYLGESVAQAMDQEILNNLLEGTIPNNEEINSENYRDYLDITDDFFIED